MKQTPGNKKTHPHWPLTAFTMAVTVSALLGLASESLISTTGLAVAVLTLFLFVALGILFDVLGVAVTAADLRPFHSMAAHKVKGAKEALLLLQNAEQVSSICNDVVGDICGIVSGTTAAVIVVRLEGVFDIHTVLLSVGVTALISGLTIGGKAVGKTIAMQKSTTVVHAAGRFLHLFHRSNKG